MVQQVDIYSLFLIYHIAGKHKMDYLIVLQQLYFQPLISLTTLQMMETVYYLNMSMI